MQELGDLGLKVYKARSQKSMHKGYGLSSWYQPMQRDEYPAAIYRRKPRVALRREARRVKTELEEARNRYKTKPPIVKLYP